MGAAVEVRGLTKKYGDFTAVDSIDFSVPEGAVIGLLGPNGAGKTTTIQMLMGITTPTSGQIHYFGNDFSRKRQKCLSQINYTSAYNHLQERITVRQNLLVFADLYGVRNARAKITELADYFALDPLMDQSFRSLSAGQRTRVNISKSLLNDPRLVMMDEPTASLDPDVRDKVMDLIERLRAERGISILYTSHNMDEVARLCDEVIFLSAGSIIRHASPQELAADVHSPSIRLQFRGDAELLRSHLIERGHDADVDFDVATILVEAHSVPALISSLDQMSGITVIDIDIRKPSLQDAFLHYTRNTDVVVTD